MLPFLNPQCWPLSAVVCSFLGSLIVAAGDASRAAQRVDFEQDCVTSAPGEGVVGGLPLLSRTIEKADSSGVRIDLIVGRLRLIAASQVDGLSPCWTSALDLPIALRQEQRYWKLRAMPRFGGLVAEAADITSYRAQRSAGASLVVP